jgi:hypothetical protein
VTTTLTLAGPTQTQITAGTDLIGTQQAEELNDLGGWEVQTNSSPTEGYAGLEVGNVAGAQTYPDSWLQWYKDDTVTTIFTAVAKGSTGYLVFMRDGQAATKEAEIFPVTVASRPRSLAKGVAHTFRANFSLAPALVVAQAA